MEKMPKEFIEYVKKHSPSLIKYVDYAKEQKIESIVMSMDSYEAEPQSLYEVLWYMYDNNLPVVLIPSDATGEEIFNEDKKKND